MSMELKPLGSRIVIEPLESEDVTAGGIFLPETAKEKPQKGTVLAIGPGDRDEAGKRIALDVKVGDVVLFAKYSGTEVAYAGENFLLMDVSDVLARVTS